MSKYITEFESLGDIGVAVSELLREKMAGHGYLGLGYNTASIEENGEEIDLIAFSVSDNTGEFKSMGYFKTPDCFNAPFDTVESFAESVIYQNNLEIGKILNKKVKHVYYINGETYLGEELTEEEIDNAELAPSAYLPKASEMEKPIEGVLLACLDGLWVYDKIILPYGESTIELGDYKQITLFNIDSFEK